MARLFVAVLCCSLIALPSSLRAQGQDESQRLSYGAFAFELQTTLPGQPEAIYDAISGDLRGWWDHSFSENPARLFLEAKPGGGFWEIFDEQGNGVLHARVLYAHRPLLLRFEGPLGLSGFALQLVVSYQFARAGEDSTQLTVSVRAAGEQATTWEPVVKNVWRHFIIERFKPYVEGGFRPLD